MVGKQVSDVDFQGMRLHPTQSGVRRLLRICRMSTGIARDVRRAICQCAAHGFLAMLCSVSISSADEWATPDRGPGCIVIHVDRQQNLSVQKLADDQARVESGQLALAIWTEGVRDRWQLFEGSWRRPVEKLDAVAEDLLELQSRGPQSASLRLMEASSDTTLLAQVRLPEITRAPQGLLVPYDGALLLDSEITFRRSSARPGQMLTAAVGTVRREGTELFRVRFPQQATSVNWSAVSDLPPALRNGLAPGHYEMEFATSVGPQRIGFQVADPELKSQVLSHSNVLKSLLPSASPLAIQAEVEQLLSHQPAFLADAMNRLDAVSGPSLTTRLGLLKNDVQQRLLTRGSVSGKRGRLPGDTGDAVIDGIRDLIFAQQWSDALEEIDSILSDRTATNPRRQALALMYCGVVLNESSVTRQDEARLAFQNAIQRIGELPDASSDLARAHNNYATFLLGSAQDRLQNHAFQMATGTRTPLFSALSEWIEARDHYRMAGKLAKSTEDITKSQVDEARLYAFLADVLRTLKVKDRDAASPFDAENVASTLARTLAERVADPVHHADPLTRAAALEIIALAEFRASQFSKALAYWEQALTICLDQGSLLGLENIHRGLGLCHQAMSADAKSPPALRHFLISEGLAELLRERYPVDECGQSRAGFFARRAFVTEHIIELLIREGRFAEALRHAEQSKARALQDLLAVRNVSVAGVVQPQIPSYDFLTDWPADTVGLEYFLGSRRAYLFIVARTGTVRVVILTGQAGSTLASRDLVASIHRVLESLDHYAERLRLRLQGGRGFDQAWQEQFAQLQEILLPPEVLADLRQCRRVVIAPHHILHYFPFAALITERDQRNLGPLDVPQPRFLIDETFDLVSAPSLSLWREMQHQPAAQMQTAAAVGIVDLPGTARLEGVAADLNGARQHYGQRLTETLVETNVVEGAVLALLEHQGALLLALHGDNHPDRPLESQLLMYPDAQHDGRLTAEDLYRHPVKRDLIVLSACYSGLADRSPVPGDDLFGIQRALLSSGARTVVSGLWDVFDTTAPELISGFHQRIAKGQPGAHALAESQRAFLKKYRSTGEVEPYLHPYFWAVYTISGDDRTTCAAEIRP